MICEREKHWNLYRDTNCGVDPGWINMSAEKAFNAGWEACECAKVAALEKAATRVSVWIHGTRGYKASGILADLEAALALARGEGGEDDPCHMNCGTYRGKETRRCTDCGKLLARGEGETDATT